MIKEYLIIIYSIVVILIIFIQMFNIKRLKSESEAMKKLKKDIYFLCENVSKVETKEEVYSLMLDAAIRFVGKADKGSILILEDDGNFYYKALRGYSDELYKIHLKKEEVYLYRCNKFKDTAIIQEPLKFNEHTNSVETTNFFRSIGALDIYSTISSPIYVDERLIGMMNIDISSKDKVFDEEDMRLIKHIKYEMELALKNFLVQDKLKYMATHDELTNLYNRRSFKMLLENEIKQINSQAYNSILVLIDLDDFKNINDTYGHNTGDKALVSFSKVLINNISKNDICARMSGDEFVIIFRNSNEEQVRKTLNQVRQTLLNEKIGSEVISFSYGFCNIDYNEGLTMDDMLSIADRNMYEDKKNKYCKR
ncbi:sensor domain-containing diguanylate cyclase [Desnuesiella massiliensis]|uniref:sensor domain-containing diguanylate cyclase n=1 Tax=Desnuesiella massiliensis TaxID=1650662 RepID=UPI0006E39A70|nr:sensor domain-containing diguanylate cyclase [Desnuesiella massiliensis]